MKKFEEQKFNIPALKGISAGSVEEHIKLYSGYVAKLNHIIEWTDAHGDDEATNGYELGELARRFSFEYNGMRNHEVYFSSLEGGPAQLSDNSPLKQMIAETWGSFEAWLGKFKALALTRGPGWAILWYDRKAKRLVHSWVDEQHLGQLQDCSAIVALDMWEHSFVADYKPSGKKAYVEDFFANLNWKNVEKNFSDASGK